MKFCAKSICRATIEIPNSIHSEFYYCCFFFLSMPIDGTKTSGVAENM